MGTAPPATLPIFVGEQVPRAMGRRGQTKEREEGKPDQRAIEAESFHNSSLNYRMFSASQHLTKKDYVFLTRMTRKNSARLKQDGSGLTSSMPGF
jgi:hypothetical protein